MMSVVMAIDRLAPRIIAIFSKYSSREYVRCMARSTLVEPDCTGKCTWSQILGSDSIASTMSAVKSLGCEVVNRTRRIPCTSATACSNSEKRIFRGVGSA